VLGSLDVAFPGAGAVDDHVGTCGGLPGTGPSYQVRGHVLDALGTCRLLAAQDPHLASPILQDRDDLAPERASATGDKDRAVSRVLPHIAHPRAPATCLVVTLRRLKTSVVAIARDQGGLPGLVVVPGSLVPDVVGDGIRAVSESRDGFGQRQSGALGGGEVRTVPPGGHRESRSSISSASFALREPESTQALRPFIWLALRGPLGSRRAVNRSIVCRSRLTHPFVTLAEMV
jgi:hypothetical protein